MAGQVVSEAQRKRLLKRRGESAKAKPNDWVKDLGGALKRTGGGAKDAADAATDVLVDKDAWRRLAPGGEKATTSDFVNAALDASMLIPGAGIVGGAARIGARQALKAGAREAAAPGAAKLSAMAERVIAREGTKAAPAAAGRHAGKGPIARALEPAKDKATRVFEKAATKQELGKGTKIGLGQTKKRLALTGGGTVGANLLARAYDEGAFDSKEKPKANKGKPAAAGARAGAGKAAYLIGNQLYPLVLSSGGEISVPNSTQRALAQYMNQGGSPDGAQVVYLGR